MKRRVIAAVDDLFFAAKIRATAEQTDVTIEFARTLDALVAAARQGERPALVLVDLQAQRIDPFALAVRLKADEDLRAVPVLGFFAHVQTELMQRARAAGFDQVLPRSAFSARLTEILQGAH